MSRPPLQTRARTTRVEATGGGAITRTTLPSGLRIISEAMPSVRSASIGIWVPVGSRHETPAVAGASHFLEHLLFKGTTSRSALDIATAMDAVGGELNAFTEKEHTCYYATVLDRDLPLAVDIVTDVVLRATVTAHDVDVERSVVLEEIAMRDDDPADLVHDVFCLRAVRRHATRPAHPRHGHVDHRASPRSGRQLLSPPLPPARHGRSRRGQRRPCGRRATGSRGLRPRRRSRRLPNGAPPERRDQRGSRRGPRSSLRTPSKRTSSLGTRGISRFDDRRFTRSACCPPRSAVA